MDQADMSCKQYQQSSHMMHSSELSLLGLLACCLIIVNGLHKAEPPATSVWLLHVDIVLHLAPLHYISLISSRAAHHIAE